MVALGVEQLTHVPKCMGLNPTMAMRGGGKIKLLLGTMLVVDLAAYCIISMSLTELKANHE